MQSFLALFIARNKEFYRDKGSLGWAILFPIMAIVGCLLVFSSEEQVLFKVGTFELASDKKIEFFEHKYVQKIVYKDIDTALLRIRQHQLDAFINIREKNVYINVNSSQGKVIKTLISNSNSDYKIIETSGKAIRYVDWVLPGILGMNIMFGALFGVGYVIVRYRKNGVLKRLNATPVTAIQFLSAQIFSRLIIILFANIAIFIGAVLLLDLTMLGSYFTLLLFAFLGGTALISIGLIVSSRTESEELAGGLLNLLTWPMMFLSGVWFSLDSAPRWLQSISDIFPLTHLVNACREIMLNGAGFTQLLYEFFVLITMTIIFLSLGAYLFRWNKQ